jgi:thiol-disulfide isomerase/thioredoxin
VDPTRALERSGSIKSPLARAQGRAATGGRSETRTAAGEELPRYGPAPEFTKTQRWFNTPGEKPLTLAGLRGRVVLIDFWTYTCINCLRTLPYVTAWDARYRKAGLTIVGVHTPEFGFERDAGNVAKAIAQNHIRYPVAQDNAYGTWDAWSNQYWPAEYLVDARGQVRYASFGEGESAKTERAIRSLLAEAGRALPASDVAPRVKAITPSRGTTTPETYLGSERAQGFRNGPIRNGVRNFGARSLAGELGRDQFAYRGTWTVSGEDARAGAGAQLQARFHARRVYLVLSGSGRVRVAVDGRRTRVVRVREQKLYELVDLPAVQEHVLTLDVDPGLRAYAFTFG